MQESLDGNHVWWLGMCRIRTTPRRLPPGEKPAIPTVPPGGNPVVLSNLQCREKTLRYVRHRLEHTE